MTCGNTWAEIDRDTETGLEARIREEEEMRIWSETRNALLSGNEFDGRTLYEWLYTKYQEFADLVDEDIDFMAIYAEGGLTPKAREIIEQEAETLASIIVG